MLFAHVVSALPIELHDSLRKFFATLIHISRMCLYESIRVAKLHNTGQGEGGGGVIIIMDLCQLHLSRDSWVNFNWKLVVPVQCREQGAKTVSWSDEVFLDFFFFFFSRKFNFHWESAEALFAIGCLLLNRCGSLRYQCNASYSFDCCVCCVVLVKLRGRFFYSVLHKPLQNH